MDGRSSRLRPVKPFPLRLGAALLLASLASGCASLRIDPLPDPIRPPKPAPAAEAEAALPPAESPPSETRTTRAPGVVIQRTVAEGIADRLGQDLSGDPIRVSFHDVPLVPFINEVFGEELGMSFVISPGLREKGDLVTLKLTEPLPPSQLFATARRVLAEYGVELREVEQGVLSFTPSQEVASRDVPLLVSGRALPEVPDSHRVIFQLVPLHAVRGPQVRGWLKQAFDGNDLRIHEDPDRNALLLTGDADTLARALAMIEVLDQPLLRGRHGLIVEPVFMSAGELARSLESVLKAEGYAASVGAAPVSAVVLLALESANKVIVFAADPQILDHAAQWARTLDTRQKEVIEEAVFTYEVRNTQAEELMETLNRMLGAGVAAAPLPEPDADADSAVQEIAALGEAQPAAGRLVVDKNRNLLLFRGSGKEWAELREVIEKLDKSVPSVLIEVLVAEVSLNDEEKSGFEFLVRGALEGHGISAGTAGSFGVGTQGLSFTLNRGGETRAMLNFFYKDDRVVIRSRPRLLVKSGGTASIDVGNEIPVITQTDAQRQVGGTGTTSVLQEISYRKTGVQLEIKPLVQANGLVDLQISQQLSEARPGVATSLAGSPTILNRQISTSLTLRDGGSLLMGGLISGSQSAGVSGVPFLSQVPGLGRLFRADSVNEDRTELLVMVTPYVVADHEEGWELTRRIREQLDLQDGFSP